MPAKAAKNVGKIGRAPRGMTSSLRQTGGRNFNISVDDYFRLENDAVDYYAKVRTSGNNDIWKISQNTGWPQYRIERIKNHVFIDDTPILRNGNIGRFDPDFKTLDAWWRLEA